ncbi:MAG: hypothetical protein D6785_14825 [Planctomycetota bacterium]|nr:MAG: hypothetical protein D6785_14825 [Planctomycetota bacterium]
MLFWILVSILTLACSTQKPVWCEKSNYQVYPDRLSASGKALSPVNKAESKLLAEKRARDNLVKLMKEKIDIIIQKWKKKSNLYHPFREKDFLENFLSTERMGAEVMQYYEDSKTGMVYCLVSRRLEQFFHQLRTQAILYISKKGKLSKQEEILWDQTMKEIIAEMEREHKKTD